GLGNLLNRIVASILRTSFEGVVPRVSLERHTDEDSALIDTAARVAQEADAYLDAVASHRALDEIFELFAATNKYVDQTAPWALAKQGERARLAQICYVVLESLRWLSLMLSPFMPGKCDALREQLGLARLYPIEGLDLWPSTFGALAPGLV